MMIPYLSHLMAFQSQKGKKQKPLIDPMNLSKKKEAKA